MELLAKGTRIGGKFTVEQLIAEGRHATLCRVVDDSGAKFALKLFVKDGGSDDFHIDREIRLAKMLNDPHFCIYHSCGRKSSSRFYTTQFVPSESLADRLIRVGSLSVYAATRVVDALLQALIYLHRLPEPFCHLGVSADNILIDLSKEDEPIKLVGLGTAYPLSSGGSDSIPIPPAEWYAESCAQVGILLYRMIYGEYPRVKQPHLGAKPAKFARVEVSIPSREIFELDDHLVSVIAKAVSSDTKSRFQSAEEMLKALRRECTLSTKSKKSFVPKTVAKGQRKGKGFEDVAGMDSLKQQLSTSVISVLKDPERARRYRISIPNGMLLYGPPGCGKTFFAEKFAEEVGYEYKYIKASDLASIYVHGSQEKIGKLFTEAREKAPIVICFDEFDALAPARSDVNSASQRGEVNELLTQLNNCGEDGIFVIATTNQPDLIDSAVLRRGRIDLKVYLSPPDLAARKAMLRKHMEGRPYEFGIDYDSLAALAEGYVASDIAFAVNEAARQAARDDRKISYLDLEMIIKSNRSSLSSQALEKFEQIRKRLDGENR